MHIHTSHILGNHGEHSSSLCRPTAEDQATILLSTVFATSRLICDYYIRGGVMGLVANWAAHKSHAALQVQSYQPVTPPISSKPHDTLLHTHLDEGEQLRQLAQAASAERCLLQRMKLNYQLGFGLQGSCQVKAPQQCSGQLCHRCLLTPASPRWHCSRVTVRDPH